MKNSINTRIITTKFLEEFFPESQKYNPNNEHGNLELFSTPSSKEQYINFKKTINQKRQKSGQPKLRDYDIHQVLIKYNNQRK